MQPESTTYQVIRGTIILIVFLASAGWLFFRALKRSEDPPKLIFKWLLTIPVIAFMVWVVAPIIGAGGFAAIGGLFLAVACGWTLAIIWGHSIASLLAKPFVSLYDGGDAQVEPRPFYSIAEAERKKGHYAKAIAEFRKQLDRFPTDFEGQFKLAETLAENLNDLPGAEIAIQRLCEQPEHPPARIAAALNALADWYLKLAVDREAVRRILEQIIERLPNSEFALAAAQRIAHLANTDQLLQAYDRPRLHLPEGIQNVGLLPSSVHLRPAETAPEKLADEYVRHLDQHPEDTEAREKLAILYADHYRRLDLAADQLNQLIEQPHQPTRQVVRWLNLLADLQIRHNAGYDAASATLERIIERYPNLAAANLARNRMDLLKLELKARTQNQTVKLGTYEQNIGLKRGPRRGP